jgi:hypothetical protein
LNPPDGRPQLTVIRHVTNYSECHHEKAYAMKPGPKPSSGTAMTHAERQSRYRAKQAAGTPTFRYRKPIDRRSRVQRWCDAVAELQDLQDDYQAWLDALPQNMEDNATAEALRAICDLDLSELQSIVPPRGFGRD